MPRVPTVLARSLEPLVHSLWLFFIVWTVVVAGLWLGADAWFPAISNPGLRAAALALSRGADVLWLLLAAANLHLHVAEQTGLARARLLALLILLLAVGLAVASAWTAYPLGAVFYTSRLGPKLGPVPFGWPLLWFVVVIGGRSFAGVLLRRASHEALSVATGAAALLTDFNLEPVAVKLRLYWFWYVAGTHDPAPPLWRNYAAWFLGAAALAWVSRGNRVASEVRPPWRPAAVFLIVNGMLLLGNVRLALAK